MAVLAPIAGIANKMLVVKGFLSRPILALTQTILREEQATRDEQAKPVPTPSRPVVP